MPSMWEQVEKGLWFIKFSMMQKTEANFAPVATRQHAGTCHLYRSFLGLTQCTLPTPIRAHTECHLLTELQSKGILCGAIIDSWNYSLSSPFWKMAKHLF